MPARARDRLTAAVLALLAGAAAAPGAAPAQERPVAAPGEIPTVPILVPRRGAAHPDSVPSYRVEPAPGVRLVSPAAGRALDHDGRSLIVPLTFAVPRDRPAGPFLAARLVIEWADSPAVIPVEIEVPRVRQLAVGLRAAAGAITPGGADLLHYDVVNLGNAPDTVRLELDLGADWPHDWAPGPAVLDRGDTLRGTVRLTAPRSLRPGTLRLATLRAATAGPATIARLRVAERDDDAGGERIRTTVFLGASGPGGAGRGLQPAAGLEAEGRVATATDAFFRFRHAPDLTTPHAFRRDLPGLRLQGGVRRPTWSATAGDVASAADPLLRIYAHGRGIDARWADDRASAAIHLARPAAAASPNGDSHLLRARAGFRTGFGTLSLLATDWAADIAFAERGQRTGTAGLALDAEPDDRQRLGVAAGVLRIRSASGRTTLGPAADAAYTFADDRTSLSARARYTPVTPRGGGGAGRELFLGASTRIAGEARAFGSAYANATEYADLDRRPGAVGGTLGIRFGAGDARVEVSGRHRASRDQGLLIRTADRSSLLAAATLPYGPVVIDARAEAGRMDLGIGSRAFGSYRAGVYWAGGWGWSSLVATRSTGGFAAAYSRVDLSGTLYWRTLTFEGGGGLRLDPGAAGRDAGAWTSAYLNLRDDLTLLAGLDYQPWRATTGAWRASAGIRKRLSLPLPLRHRPTAAGSVFEDLDGDRVRDAGEPGLPGIALLHGDRRHRTGPDGTFAIDGGRTAPGAELRVDVASLPPGMLVAPGPLPRRGEMHLPVVRAATLTLTLFIDGNGNGRRDAGERPAADTRITLLGGDGRRDASADAAGIARFPGLLPGRYTILVGPATPAGEPGGSPAAEPDRIEVVLPPGEHRSLERPVAGTRRERAIRGLDLPLPEAGADAAGGGSAASASGTEASPPHDAAPVRRPAAAPSTAPTASASPRPERR